MNDTPKHCSNCQYPMHGQYKGYHGIWNCFHPGRTCGRTICQTPVEEWNNFPANNRRLAEAKVPSWCPGFTLKAKSSPYPQKTQEV